MLFANSFVIINLMLLLMFLLTLFSPDISVMVCVFVLLFFPPKVEKLFLFMFVIV